MWIQERIQLSTVEEWKKVEPKEAVLWHICQKPLIAFYIICSLQNYMLMVLIWLD